MKSQFVPLVLAAGLAFACRSDTEKPQPAPKPVAAPAQAAPAHAAPAQAAPVPSRADRLAALTKEQREATDAYFDALQKAMGENQNPTPEEMQKIRETVKEPDSKAYLARAQHLLDEDVKDITAFKTIQWMMSNGSDPESTKTLIGLLERHHMDRPEMFEICSLLARNDVSVVQKLAESSPHRDVRGRATFSLTEALKSDIQTAGYIEGKSPQELDEMKGWLGAEKLAALQALDVKATEAKLEQLYESVVKDYGDVVLNKGSKRETTLGKMAGSALYEIRNLAVGMTTPEIEGVDLDSVAFKLSEYRGKVVLLDFWGNW